MSAPINAKTEKQICQLRRDNFPANGLAWSILVTVGEVSLHPPADDGREYVSIPRADFDAIVRWYLRNKKDAK